MVTTRSTTRIGTENGSKRDVGGKVDASRSNDAKSEVIKNNAVKDPGKGEKETEYNPKDGYISPDGAGAFAVLPPELITSILRECGNSGLLNINRTSRFFHAYCRLMIYETVDLCIHNESTPFKSDYVQRQPRYRHAKWIVKDGEMLEKQRLFIRTMEERPMYAKLVKHLVWTFKTFVWREKTPMNKHIVTVNSVWAMFAKLNNVISLDFCCLFADWPLRTPPSHLLFPNATSIRLVGQLNLPMAQDILNARNLGHVENLELDYATNLSDKAFDRGNLAKQIDMKPKNFKKKVQLLQPLAAYLLDVKSHFKSLTTLSIRAFDFAFGAERELVVVSSIWYTALSKLIAAVTPTLRSLLIEQAYVTQILGGGPWNRYEDKNRIYTEVQDKRFSRLMLLTFQKHILPVLQNGSWPHLQHLKLVGEPWSFDHIVGHDDWYKFDLIPILDTLERDLGNQVRISVDRQASKTFGYLDPVGFGDLIYGFESLKHP